MTDSVVIGGFPQSAAVPTDPIRFAVTVAEMAVGWQELRDPRMRLTEIVAGAVGVVPGCEHVALVVFDEHDQLVAKAVSGPGTTPMIALQNELGEGPCRQTAATNEVIRSLDVATDARWPRFGPRARLLGIGSMLCTPLMLGHRSFGSLSMASGSTHAFDTESESLASIFSAHAAIALADADRVEHLAEAMDIRDLIGQAKGILMVRYDVTADTAFGVLVRESRRRNVKVADLARIICSLKALPEGARP